MNTEIPELLPIDPLRLRCIRVKDEDGKPIAIGTIFHGGKIVLQWFSDNRVVVYPDDKACIAAMPSPSCIFQQVIAEFTP